MSKSAKILNALLNKKELTSLTIADKFRTTRGQARIGELIKMGFPIQCNIRKTKSGHLYKVWYI